MADTPQTLALITLAQAFAGDVVRQSNRTAQTLRLLPIVVGEGKNCAWVAESTGAQTKAHAEGADTTDFVSDAQASATLAWAEYEASFRVTGLALATSRTSSTPLGNIQLWARNYVNGAAAMMSLINSDIFNGAVGASPPEVEGLDRAIGDDTITYATINRGSAAYWKPTVVDPGVATALSFPQIRDDLRKILEASGELPQLAACSPAVFNQVVGLFDSTRRHVQTVTELNNARGKIVLDAGYSMVEVDGCLFYKDKDCTANRIYYLNTDHIRLEVLPLGALAELAMPGTMLQGNDGFGQVPLMMMVEMLAKTGDSAKGRLGVKCQLVVDKPNSCGVRKNVAA